MRAHRQLDRRLAARRDRLTVLAPLEALDGTVVVHAVRAVQSDRHLACPGVPDGLVDPRVHQRLAVAAVGAGADRVLVRGEAGAASADEAAAGTSDIRADPERVQAAVGQCEAEADLLADDG